MLHEPRVHSAQLVPLIRDVLVDAGYQRSDLGAVAVSKGPGSYTGLRIGVSTAKGLAFGLEIPIVGVATFDALAWANRAAPSAHPSSPRKLSGLSRADLLTTAPSRRNEAYWQLWQVDTEFPIAVTAPRSDNFADVAEVLRKLNAPLILVGEGLEALRPVLEAAGVSVSVISPDESHRVIHGVSALGHHLVAEGKHEDVAQFEPFYLKEFVAKKGGSPFDRLPF